MAFWGARTLWSGTVELPRLYPNAGASAPSSGAPANEFVSWFESFGDLLTSFPCLSSGLAAFFQKAWAPDTQWQPAAACIGDPDSQMTHGRNGGWWV